MTVAKSRPTAGGVTRVRVRSIRVARFCRVHVGTNYWYPGGMAHNTSISLDEHFSDFLAREIASGRYRNTSEVVRAALRLLEDEATRMAALRAALIAGEESGPAEDFDFDAFIAAKKS